MKNFIEKNKDLLKMFGGTIVIVASATWALSHSIHTLSSEMHQMENRLSEKIISLDKRLTVVETVLIMQGYPIKNIAANNTETLPIN